MLKNDINRILKTLMTSMYSQLDDKIYDTYVFKK